MTAADGRLLGEPEYGNSRNDAFDEWNGSRDAQLSARSERQYLPTDIGEYEEELDQNGHWVYERPYGNVWVPNVSDYDDWQPYYYGRWVWYPVIGWNWVSSESWGWSVYHYGRWNWRFGLGWYWIPQSHWGPAWVHWWSDRDYIGWCPLTWYNRPGYLFNNRFYDRYDDRYFSAHNRAMTVVRRDHLQSYDVGRRHVGSADLDRIGRVELRGPTALDPPDRRQRPAPGHRGPAGPGGPSRQPEPGEVARAFPVLVLFRPETGRDGLGAPVERPGRLPARREPECHRAAVHPERRGGQPVDPVLPEPADLRQPRPERRRREPPQRGRLAEPQPRHREPDERRPRLPFPGTGSGIFPDLDRPGAAAGADVRE